MENNGCGCIIVIFIIGAVISIISSVQRCSGPGAGDTAADSLYSDTVSVVETEVTDFAPPEPSQPSRPYMPPQNIEYVTTDDPYDEGYDDGYDQGYEDGRRGRYREYGYDDSNDYQGHDDTEYRDGYEEGYDDGYYQGASEYEDDY